jgi:putative peptidoglycan lipid II flippase
VTSDDWRPGPLSPTTNDDEPEFWTRFGRQEDSVQSEPTQQPSGWWQRKTRPEDPVGDPAAAPGFGTAVPAFRPDRQAGPDTVAADPDPGPAPVPAPQPQSVESPIPAPAHTQPRRGPYEHPVPPSLDETGVEETVATTSTFLAVDDDRPQEPPSGRGTGRLLSATAIMATGTIASRLLGLVRVVLAGFLLGTDTRRADILSLATTVPNSLYILFAGGALNTVLVPQIVRATKNDKDGGKAYTNRIMTAFMLVVALATVILVVAAPLVTWIYSGAKWHTPEVATHYQSMVMLTALCLPQVFFFGAFFLGAQVLNARDAFGPMMWAPIANNVVQVALLITYAGVWGLHTDNSQPFTTGQTWLLGLGSVFGIAVQAAVLIPFMRKVGFRYTPRFDLRHTGLGHTFHLAKWTLGFVAVNQLALIVVTNLATSATAGGSGAGVTTYNYANLLWVLPHSLITVGLATAILPSLSRMVASGELPEVAREFTKAIRLAVSALVPVALIFLTLGVPIGEMAFRKGGALVGWTLVFFAIGLVPFSVQYLILRGYYAFEDTRSTFMIQLVIAGLNALLAIVGATFLAPNPNWVAPALAGAFTLAYVGGVVVSARHFRVHVPDIDWAGLLNHIVRIVIAAAPGAVVGLLVVLVQKSVGTSAILNILGVALGLVVAAVSYIVLARRMHIEEVEEVLGILMRRLRRGKGPSLAPTAPDAPPPAGSSPSLEPERSAPQPVEGSADDETAVIPAVSAASASALPQGQGPATVVSSTPARMPGIPAGDPLDTFDDADEGTQVGLTMGDILGGRYRLEEQLSVRGSTVTWRAVDQVLSRSVLVHLLSPDNPRAPSIIETARQAARATDSRFLRVLDAVPDAEVSYIVCEWAEGMELEQLLSSGPLTALESAWLVRELADALSTTQASGLHHGRLTPDAVVISTAGNVKINGFLIDAALHPRTRVEAGPLTETRDVEALGKLLYATLASRWPDGPGFGLAAAPTDLDGTTLSPAKVRAGVSPTLDRLTSDVLNGRIASASQLAASLTTVLGSADASTDLSNRVRYPMLRESPVHTSDIEPTAIVAMPGSQTSGPLVIPESTKASQSPHRLLLVSGVLVVVVVVALIVGLISVFARTNQTSGGSPATSRTSTSSKSGGPQAGPYAIAAARDFDPVADNGSGDENPNQVALAYDGKTDTAWTTLVYKGNAKLGGLKPGVGLIVDLGRAVSVGTVSLTMVGEPTAVEIRIPATDPDTVSSPPLTSASQWKIVASNATTGTSADLSPSAPVMTRFVMVYLTSLPAVTGGFKAGVAEVVVKG